MSNAGVVEIYNATPDVAGEAVLHAYAHEAMSVSIHEHLSTTTIEYTADASGNVAAVAIVTPASTKSLAVYEYCVNTDGASGAILLDFLTSTTKVLRLYPSKNSQISSCPMHITGAIDEVLTFETQSIGNGSKVFVTINHADHD